MEGKSSARCGWARLLLAVACVAAVVVGGGAATSGGAPAPSPDCSTLITDLVDCLSYVQNGSTVAKPEGTCCKGLKKVVKTAVSCLCDAFESSAGLPINITKALSLPAACRVSTPSVGKCKIAGLGTSPAPAPKFFSPLPPAAAPSSARGGVQGVPAPAPSKAATSAVSITAIASLLTGAAIAAYLCL